LSFEPQIPTASSTSFRRSPCLRWRMHLSVDRRNSLESRNI